MNKAQNNFFSLAIKEQALLFGDFTLKSGKKSPYFFNIAALFEGGFLHELSSMYLDIIDQLEDPYDVIFGPAYKGIPLASSIATQLGLKNSKAYPVCFDRKEEKDHGEGGALVGSVKNKKVLIIDDVLTAGTALKNSIKLIQEAGGTISAALIALDRQEQDEGEQVSKKLVNELNIPIFSISNLENLVVYLETSDKRGIAKKLKASLKS